MQEDDDITDPELRALAERLRRERPTLTAEARARPEACRVATLVGGRRAVVAERAMGGGLTRAS